MRRTYNLEVGGEMDRLNMETSMKKPLSEELGLFRKFRPFSPLFPESITGGGVNIRLIFSLGIQIVFFVYSVYLRGNSIQNLRL